jgi:hypothetical protein
MQPHRVLGISLGTRRLGIAVVEDYSIFECQVKSFTGKWSEQKLHKILSVLSGYIDDYGVTAVALKVPTLSVEAAAIEELLAGIESLTVTRKIKIYKCSLSQLKKAWSDKQRLNRKGLLRCVLQKYPDLLIDYEREIGNKNSYYEKLFEAVGVCTLHITNFEI